MAVRQEWLKYVKLTERAAQSYRAETEGGKEQSCFRNVNFDSQKLQTPALRPKMFSFCH